jgi:hypothetical protein
VRGAAILALAAALATAVVADRAASAPTNEPDQQQRLLDAKRRHAPTRSTARPRGSATPPNAHAPKKRHWPRA